MIFHCILDTLDIILWQSGSYLIFFFNRQYPCWGVLKDQIDVYVQLPAGPHWCFPSKSQAQTHVAKLPTGEMKESLAPHLAPLTLSRWKWSTNSQHLVFQVGVSAWALLLLGMGVSRGLTIIILVLQGGDEAPVWFHRHQRDGVGEVSECQVALYPATFFYFNERWRWDSAPHGALMNKDRADRGGAADLHHLIQSPWVSACWWIPLTLTWWGNQSTACFFQERNGRSAGH